MSLNDSLDVIFDPTLNNRKNKTAGAEKALRSNFGKKRSGQSAGINRSNLAKMARVAGKTPEVMVKVSGGAKGLNHVREHLNYITRNGDVEAESEQGEIISNREQVREKARAWSEADQGQGKGRGRQTVNLVLSMPPGTDEKKLKNAVRNFAARTFSADREYLFVQHHDTKHPHCHLTLQAVGVDGKRLSPNKAQLQVWRESFAEALREQGVKAEATPRRSRGVVKKGEKQAVRHARKRNDSTVVKGQIESAKKRLLGDERERPWEARIAKQQDDVRKAWGNVAKELEMLPEGRKMAQVVKQFVAQMPKTVTKEQELVAAMRKTVVEQKKDKSQELER